MKAYLKREFKLTDLAGYGFEYKLHPMKKKKYIYMRHYEKRVYIAVNPVTRELLFVSPLGEYCRNLQLEKETGKLDDLEEILNYY